MYVVSTPEFTAGSSPSRWTDARPRRGVRAAAQTTTTVKLADLVQLAIGLNCAAAAKNGVRLRGYTIDVALPEQYERSVLSTIDTLLGRAVRNAQWSSLVTAEATVEQGLIKLRIRYAKPAVRLDSEPIGLDWIDEFWSWHPSSQPACKH